MDPVHLRQKFGGEWTCSGSLLWHVVVQWAHSPAVCGSPTVRPWRLTTGVGFHTALGQHAGCLSAERSFLQSSTGPWLCASCGPGPAAGAGDCAPRGAGCMPLPWGLRDGVGPCSPILGFSQNRKAVWIPDGHKTTVSSAIRKGGGSRRWGQEGGAGPCSGTVSPLGVSQGTGASQGWAGLVEVEMCPATSDHPAPTLAK